MNYLQTASRDNFIDPSTTKVKKTFSDIMQEKQAEDEKKIAVFIDIQNMNADTQFDALFSKLEATGKVDLKMAYAEWKDVGTAIRKNMLRHHVKQIQTSRLASSGKNGADMQIVIDVMNALNEKDDIDTFVIAAGDTDYIPLINEIASRGKRCIVAAHNEKVGEAVKDCCHEFISLDEIAESAKAESVEKVAETEQPVETKKLVKAAIVGSAPLVKPLAPVKKGTIGKPTPTSLAPKKDVAAEKVAVKPRPVRKKTKGGGVTIENDKFRLTLFPEQWITVLDAMEKCCNYGAVDFSALIDYIEDLMEQGEVTFSKNIIVPVINTFVKHELFTQPARGRIVIADDFERKRKDFIHEYQLE
jgi:uncharacterized LabA/DUF88 family protein